eukprot:tig00000796_g4242.t1
MARKRTRIVDSPEEGEAPEEPAKRARDEQAQGDDDEEPEPMRAFMPRPQEYDDYGEGLPDAEPAGRGPALSSSEPQSSGWDSDEEGPKRAAGSGWDSDEEHAAPPAHVYSAAYGHAAPDDDEEAPLPPAFSSFQFDSYGSASGSTPAGAEEGGEGARGGSDEYEVYEESGRVVPIPQQPEEGGEAAEERRSPQRSPERSPEGPAGSPAAGEGEEEDEAAAQRRRGEEASRRLAAQDSIMEPNVLASVRDFVKAGGNPNDVVRNLSGSYTGLASMCNLVSSWISKAEAEGGSAPGLGGEGRAPGDALIVSLLERLATERFDPKRVDTLFTEGAAAPTWLFELLEYPEWRSLLYKLADDPPNRSCLMLAFCIRKISEQAGSGSSSRGGGEGGAGRHDGRPARQGDRGGGAGGAGARGGEEAIASVATAAAFFSIFNGALKRGLAVLWDLPPDGTAYPAHLAELGRLCCHSEAGYALSQALLQRLAALPGGDRLRRVAQELEARAAEEAAVRGGSAARERLRTVRLCAAPAWAPQRPSHAEAASAVASMLASGRTTPGDVLKLHALYCTPGRAPPPVQLLRDPEVVGLLTADLFASTRPMSEAHREKALELLAHAACARDTRTWEGPAPEGPASGSEDPGDRAEAAAALREAQAICARGPYALLTVPGSADALAGLCERPVVGWAVCAWLQPTLGDPGYTASASSAQATPTFAFLLGAIADRHPLLRPRVLDLLSAPLEDRGGAAAASAPAAAFDFGEAESDAMMEVRTKRQLLDAVLLLLCRGHALPVLAWLERRAAAARLDRSLLRYFLSRLLSLVEAPYSPAFASALLRTLATPEALEALQGSTAVPLVSRLVSALSLPAAGGYGTPDPALRLGQAEAAALRTLAARYND